MKALFAALSALCCADETRALRGSLAQEIAAIEGPAWVAYSADAVPREGSSCRGDQRGTVHLEGFKTLHVFIRVEARHAVKVRSISPDCEIDAGGLPVLRLSGVTRAQSVAFLAAERAVQAIGMHSGAEADAALEEFASARHGEKVRKQAAYWLGSTRGRRGAELLAKLLREDPSERFRVEALFGLSLAKEGIPILIEEARRPGADRKIREKAMFWLARSEDAAAKRFVDELLTK